VITNKIILYYIIISFANCFNLKIGSLSGRFGGLQVFFVAKFSSSFTGFGVWDNTKGTVSPGVASATGVKVGGWVQFGSVAPFNTVEVYVGISYVSINNGMDKDIYLIPLILSLSLCA